ncbi:MAG: anthranilate synthase component I [Oscillospiraceae bacterium]|nr:anthranilate synthase component I [Oscillospiraceae bacterium]
MLSPSYEEARKLAEGMSVVPLSEEIYSDLRTPIQTLKILKKMSVKYYLLESVEGGDKWGRYSYLGFDPALEVRGKGEDIEIISNVTIKQKSSDPNSVLRDILSQYKSPKVEGLPPFTGGFVGYFSYNYIRYAEPTLNLDLRDDGNFYDFDLLLFDKVICFDRLRQKIIVINNIKTDNFEENYNRGVMELDHLCTLLKTEHSYSEEYAGIKGEFKPLFSKEEYCRMVTKTKEYIREGDIFQAVISNRLEAEFEGSLLNTYRVLRTINPSPYMFYMKYDDCEIAGASPETIVSISDGTVSTFPIAGTRKRGRTEAEDAELISGLLSDEKELSEHNMLVDLGRNDIGKVSEYGTVHVEGYKEILKYSHVIHIASTVRGKLRAGLDQFDALSAVLPAGTLSGAPKYRACEIISELEGVNRGVYGGAVGYIDFKGNMDMCIAIRMASKKNGKVYVQAGAGIVYDSVPESEYQECINKASAMAEAIKRTSEVR